MSVWREAGLVLGKDLRIESGQARLAEAERVTVPPVAVSEQP